MKIDWSRIGILIAILGAGVVGYFLYPLSHPAPAPVPNPPAPVPGYIGAPPSVKVAVGRQVQIDTTGTAPAVFWHLLAAPVKSGSPVDLTEINSGKSVIFTTATPGVYCLRAEAVQGTAIVEEHTEVTAGDVPPGPGPGPVPPPQPPSDPFMTALQAAWTADVDPSKAHERDVLQGMYLTYASSIPANVVTYGDLLASMLQVEKAIFPGTMPLVGERKAIGDYLNANLPLGGSQPVDKAVTSKVFGTVAKYLGQLK